MPTIGKRIERLRAGLDLSREELAERINVSRQTLYRWEADKTVPKTFKLNRLCEFFSVTPEFIIYGVEHEDKAVSSATAAKEPALSEEITKSVLIEEPAQEIAPEVSPRKARLKTALKLLCAIAVSAAAVFTVFVLVSVGIIYFQPHSGVDEVTVSEYHNPAGAAVFVIGIILAVAGVVSLVFWLISRKKRKLQQNVTK